MGKIYDSTYFPTDYKKVSQTPPNMKQDNYYLHSLQQKIDAEWPYRPNRVDVEQERSFGLEDYFPMEVVIQSVRGDSGEKVSDDLRRLVFRDIFYDVKLGTKFRFSYKFDINQPDAEKNVWLVTNKDTASPTSQAVISRCNGTLGSIWIDDNGETHYHYEPVILTNDLKSTGVLRNNTILMSNVQTVIVAQHNQYTSKYIENQRFVIGYDKVYKITAINKFDGLLTYDPRSAGIILLYAEIDEISPLDNFDTRIAFNKNYAEPSQPSDPSDNYEFEVLPRPLPRELFSEPVVFSPRLTHLGEQLSVPIETVLSMTNGADPYSVCEFTPLDNGQFTLKRNRLYNRGDLKVTCSISKENSPTGEEFSLSFTLSLRGLE